MATIRAYTTIEQSRKLAEILPLESADMYWMHGKLDNVKQRPTPNIIGNDHDEPLWNDYDIPCWSLASLLDVLPKGTNISTPKPINELGYCCWNQYDEIYADNPIDACYEMIFKLNELKML